MRILRVFLATVMLLAVSTVAYAEMSVTLGWDIPDCNPDIVRGYEICYGTESGQYGTCEVVAGYGTDQAYYTDQHTVSGLTDGVMTYFAARTLGWNGHKSGFSSEVRTDGYTLPGGGGVAIPAPGSCYIVTID